MKRRQTRSFLVVVSLATGLCLTLVAPWTNAVPADAGAPAVSTLALGTLLAPAIGHSQVNPNDFSGYYENEVGALTLTTTVTVPAVKCTKSATWGTADGIVAVMDSPDPVSGIDEHGGGVEVGCSATGAPTYTPMMCDPTFPNTCGALADPVGHGDTLNVTVAATGGCNPECSSVVVTVNDATQGWTESRTGSAQSDFDTFVVAVGTPPLTDFGKVTLSHVTVNGSGFGGQRFNLIDNAGHTLARASGVTNNRTAFSVKWLRLS